MKKIIVAINIFSFLNLTGCYYQEQLTSDNYNFDTSDNITITTQDSSFILKGDKCYVKSDTLFYKIVVPLDQKRMKLKTVSIPLNKIDRIVIERLDRLKTTIVVVGAIVATVLVIGAATIDFTSIK